MLLPVLGTPPGHRWGLSPPSGFPLYQLSKEHLTPGAEAKTHLTEGGASWEGP